MADPTITEIARRVEPLGQGSSGSSYLTLQWDCVAHSLNLSLAQLIAAVNMELPISRANRRQITAILHAVCHSCGVLPVLLAAAGTYGPRSDGPYPAIVSYMDWDDLGYCVLRYGNNYVFWNTRGTYGSHNSLLGRNVVIAWSWVNNSSGPRAPPPLPALAPPEIESKKTGTRTASHNKRPPSRARKQAKPQQAV